MIPRDHLRLIAVIPFADHLTSATVERAWWWADDILVGVQKDWNLDADSVLLPDLSPESIQNLNFLWKTVGDNYRLDDNSFIVILNSGELITDPRGLRTAVRTNPSSRVALKLHWMWSQNEYRIDRFAPAIVWPVIPYLREARFDRRAQYAERGPNHVQGMPASQHPASDMLGYRFSSHEDREFWAGASGIQNLSREPILETWDKGGLL